MVRTVKMRSFTRLTHQSWLSIRSILKRNSSSEVNTSEVKKIRILKRLFSFGLFGSTLLLAFALKTKKRREWSQILSETNYIGPFGNLILHKYKSWVLPEDVLRVIKSIEKLTYRESDILLISYPKTGTTWLQEILWLLTNNLDYENAKKKTIFERFPYIEFPTPGIKTITQMKNRRLLKTHLAPDLLNLDGGEQADCEHCGIGTPKIIAIVRDPKDVLVSYYHFCRMNNLIGFTGTFDEFFDLFVKDQLPYGSITQFYNALLNLSQGKFSLNILIVKYEDLKSNFANEVNRITQFLSISPLSSDEMSQLKLHTSFEKMAQNPSVNYSQMVSLGVAREDEQPFMRKGIVGDWKNHLSPLQTRLIEDKLKLEASGDFFGYIK